LEFNVQLRFSGISQRDSTISTIKFNCPLTASLYKADKLPNRYRYIHTREANVILAETDKFQHSIRLLPEGHSCNIEKIVMSPFNGLQKKREQSTHSSKTGMKQARKEEMSDYFIHLELTDGT
jgi:hypothetical protein